MSQDDEHVVQVHAEVPKETKQLAKEKLEHGGITRVVRQKLTEVAHGHGASEKDRVKDHLRELREDRKELKRKRTEIDERLDEVEVKIERAENKLEELRDKEGEYEGALRMMEEMMAREGTCVFPEHGKVKDAAQVGNCTPQDVIADLKDRNPEMDDSRFSEGV